MVESTGDETEFIETLTLGACRGKCLVYIGEDDGDETAKNWFFRRNNDEGTLENTALQSYYYKEYNGGNPKKYVEDALPFYIGKYNENGKGLFVLQGQLTDNMAIFGPKFKESQNYSRMNDYVEGLNTSDDLQYINILMRDFVSPKKAKDILKLNVYKKLVKIEKEGEFVEKFCG